MTPPLTGLGLGLLVCGRCRRTVRAVGAAARAVPAAGRGCTRASRTARDHGVFADHRGAVVHSRQPAARHAHPHLVQRRRRHHHERRHLAGASGFLADRGAGVLRQHRGAAAEAVALGEILLAVSRKAAAQRSAAQPPVPHRGVRRPLVDARRVRRLAARGAGAGPIARDLQVRPGALAFAAVVVLTMLAAQSFDERLLWDRQIRWLTARHTSRRRSAIGLTRYTRRLRLPYIWILPVIVVIAGVFVAVREKIERAPASRSRSTRPMIWSRTRPRSATRRWKSARSRRSMSPRTARRSSSRREFIATPPTIWLRTRASGWCGQE